LHQALPTAGKASQPFRRILVPLDGSALAEEALPAAIALAWHAEPSGAVLLVRVSRSEYPGAVYGGSMAFPCQAQQVIDEYLMNLRQQILAQGIAVEAVNPAGETAQGIGAAAQTHQADLILMVTHARRGMSRLLHGSVADRVL
jgi:nucleotide-binding universal stress UspA family protein